MLLVGRPDGVITDTEGNVLAVVEMKAHSCNNYPGSKAEDQVLGQMIAARVRFGVLVTILKVPGQKIRTKVYHSSEAKKKLTGWLTGHVINNLCLPEGIKLPGELTLAEVKEAVEMFGITDLLEL